MDRHFVGALLVKVDDITALHRYADSEQHPLAKGMLAVVYYYKEDKVRSDQFAAEALTYLREQSNINDKYSSFMLGCFFMGGIGVPEDEPAAVRLYKQSAEQGHAAALLSLGGCYQYGDGVPEDKAAARRYYQLAADQGYPSTDYL